VIARGGRHELDVLTFRTCTHVQHACSMAPKTAELLKCTCCMVLPPTGAVDMPLGESDWLRDDGQPLRGWWYLSSGPGGSYVIPAVLLTGVALGSVAALVYMRQRRLT
jgi:hypothetical protein